MKRPIRGESPAVRHRRPRLLIASAAVALAVIIVISVAWLDKPKSGATPLILIQLDDEGSTSAAGVVNYVFNVSTIASGVSVGCLQLHLGTPIGYPVAAPFTASLASSPGGTYATFNSTLSSWGGNGVSVALCSDGGWTSGDTSTVSSGSILTATLGANESATSLLIGLSCPEGNFETSYPLR
jgi:hypothetical protein